MSVQLPESRDKKCRMCGMQRPLIKAHVIPEAFFRPLRDGEQAPKIFSAGKEPPKKSPIGIYDETILCKECETKFDAIDSYGTAVFLSDFHRHFSLVQHADGVHAFESESVDQTRLLRFLIAVLWRASVSTHPFYRAVELGPFERPAVATIQHPHQPIPPLFSALLARWLSTPDLEYASKSIGSPGKQRIDGANVYRFHLGQVVALIRASKTPFLDARARLSVGAQEKLFLIGPSFEESQDLQSMVSTAKASFAAHPPRGRRSK